MAGAALGLACAAPQPDAPPVTGTGRVSGKILDVHPASRRLELADAGRRFSVYYTDETLVKSGTVELQVADIREGDRIVVSLDDAGKAQARIITIAGPEREPRPSPSAAKETPAP